MASVNKSAFGTLLKIAGSAVLELRKVTLSSKGATIDITNHGSLVRAMEYVAGLLDTDISFDGNWIGAGTAGKQGFGTASLGKAMTDGTITAFTIVYTDATPSTCAFNGIVTGYNIDAPHDGNLKLSGSIKVTGGISWTGGA